MELNLAFTLEGSVTSLVSLSNSRPAKLEGDHLFDLASGLELKNPFSGCISNVEGEAPSSLYTPTDPPKTPWHTLESSQEQP